MLPHVVTDVMSEHEKLALVVKIVVTVLVVVATFALSRFGSSRFRGGLERGGLQANVAILLARLLWIAIWLLGFGIILYVLGVGLTPFAALVGIVGLAGSLALQQVLQNLVAGVYLLAERPFEIGDKILVVGPVGANHEGTVEDIQMRTTHLRNVQGELILIPNSAIFGGIVTNRTAVGGYASQVTVTFPRTTDPDEVRSRMAPLLQDLPGVMETPSAELNVDKVGKDDWTANILFWVDRNDATARVVWALASAFPDATVNNGDGA